MESKGKKLLKHQGFTRKITLNDAPQMFALGI